MGKFQDQKGGSWTTQVHRARSEPNALSSNPLTWEPGGPSPLADATSMPSQVGAQGIL